MEPSYDAHMRTYGSMFGSIESILVAASKSEDPKTSDKLCAGAIWMLAAAMSSRCALKTEGIDCAQKSLLEISRELFDGDEQQSFLQLLDECLQE